MMTIGTVQVEQESVVIIYDVSTGDIAHRHDVVTMKGAVHPDQKTREKDAMSQFRQAQPGFAGETAALHVDRSAFKPSTLYKVDPQRRSIVENPMQKRPARISKA